MLPNTDSVPSKLPAIINKLLDESDAYIRPQALELLVVLASRPNATLRPQDLAERLHTTHDVIVTLVCELRRALRDDARNPRYIRTLYPRAASRRYGYQYIGPRVDAGQERVA